MTIHTVIWQKPDSTFADGLTAYNDMFSGASQQFLDSLASVDTNLISSGVVNVAETYSWNQATSRLTVTRDINDMTAFLSARDGVRDEYMSTAESNGWTRIKSVEDN
jgi:hypothetical protein